MITHTLFFETQKSFITTHPSFLKGDRTDIRDQTICLSRQPLSGKEKIKQENFNLFSELVKEYCGKDLSEILEKSTYKDETAEIWKENGIEPPEIYRLIIELLHLAQSKENCL